eukprot:6192706-Pleurochrysis_carterae.AAC.1
MGARAHARRRRAHASPLAWQLCRRDPLCTCLLLPQRGNGASTGKARSGARAVACREAREARAAGQGGRRPERALEPVVALLGPASLP